MTAATDTRVAAAIDAPPRRWVDFERRLVCILGLPFDAIDLAQAVQRIRDAAFGGSRCFVSTPNLNFAIATRSDAAFRGSVLRSDLSLVDGMPLVWIARLLGLPVRERVSGADVFEALQAHAGPPLTVYLFGGPPGAAARACEGINRRGGGVRCVGHDTAGFGSIESMSGDEQIARINRSGAQFVVVALGAAKGQAWIEHNAARLSAPVLSHLGAVVNFAAGTVARAPRWMQSLGLEWLWRIKEEPSLWRRYWSDGVALAALLLSCVLPDALEARRSRGPDARAPRLESTRTPRGHVLRLSGDWRGADGIVTLRAALARCAADEAAVSVDLAGVSGIGDSATALLLVARGWFDAHGGWALTGASAAVTTTLRRKLAAVTLLGDRR
jgi:N-acetylglucosaminyldiphosphoundecaprenol N-acetyl-beta-D-mannosaminyltransferase